MSRLVVIFSTIFVTALISLNALAEKSLDHLVLNTNMGPVVIQMDDTGAPNHFAAMTRMVEMGVYNGTSFNYAQDGYYVQLGDETFRDYGFYPEQIDLIRPLENEITEFLHYRGAVTMPSAPDAEFRGGEYIFTVMLDRSGDLDKEQTIIGFVIHGINILDETSRGPSQDSLLADPLKIETAVFMTKDAAIEHYSNTKKTDFESEIFQFSKYSFLFIVFIQLVLFYGKAKIDAQTAESIQIVVLLVAAFSAMAQFYPTVGDSTVASLVLVASMLLCFKIMSSLERSRGLQK